ncbi:MAG: Rieske (2Fe-2S) protein [Bacteroidales bacterium]|nr:Rieske (2Fe-2S) protein [Bacteroidales bacterium]
MEEENINRRSFIIRVLYGIGGVLGAITMVPVISALFSPLLRNTPRDWRVVGRVNDFKIGKTVLVKYKNALPLEWSGLSSETASWLQRNSEKEFTAFAINCTHLGCPVRWEGDAELFLCPCHGGVYNKDGSYAAGPPPHGLNKYPVRIRNNNVEILTSPVPITNIGGEKS